MTITNPKKHAMNYELKENRLLENIEIQFKTKDEKGFKTILLELKKITQIVTESIKFDDTTNSLLFKVRVKVTPFFQEREFTNIGKKFNKILESITIKPYCEPLEKKLVSEISRSQVNAFIFHFLEQMDCAFFESILMNALLLCPNGRKSLTKEYLAGLGLDKHFEILQKLFIEGTYPFRDKEIKKIFELLPRDDFLLLKIVFSLILIRNKGTTAESLFNKYFSDLGSEPFRHRFVNYIFPTTDFAYLELFFKDYILRNNIIDEVREKAKVSKVDVKVMIPFDLRSKEYNLATLPKESLEIILDFFRNRTKKALNVFREVLEFELMRLKIDIDGLLISFRIDSTERGLERLRKHCVYFDDLKGLLDNKLDAFRRARKSGRIDLFVLIRCFYITNRSNITYDWSKTFKIRDKNHRKFTCNIIHNRTHFNNMPLEMESELLIQANLRVDYKVENKFKVIRTIKDKVLQIIDIEIIDNFKVIKYHLGTQYSEEKWLENTAEGLSKFTYSNKKNKRLQLCQQKILSNPLRLLDIYEGTNNTIYDVKINGAIITKPKKELIDELDEHNLIVDYTLVKSAVSRILGESTKILGLSKKPMYNTVGIFLSKKDKELVLVYENTDRHRIIGENSVQSELLERLEQRTFDKQGTLTENYFRIIHLATIPLNCRLSVIGYCAIQPFLYALKDKLDMFPYLFLIGKHGCGKTATLELFFNILFGTIMKNPDDVRTEARMTKILTESLFTCNIDDIDTIPEEQLGFLKSFGTRRGATRKRMDGQKMNQEQMYSSVIGSANSHQFLMNDDDAFRIRCLIHRINTSIQSDVSKHARKVFKENYDIIKESDLVYGYYLLEKSLEFFEKLNVPGNTRYEKCTFYFNSVLDKIDTFLTANTINPNDIRRLTVYTLIYIGWNLWNYIFNLKGFKSDFLDNAIDLNSGVFLQYFRELEKAELDISLEVFDNILEFYRINETKYGYNRDANKIIVVKTEFINDYDKFAFSHKYRKLGSVSKLAELQAKLLNIDIVAKTIRYVDEHNISHAHYGVHFYYEEIYKLRNGFEPPKLVRKIEVNSVLTIPEKFDKLQFFLDKLTELFDSNKGNGLDLNGVLQVLGLIPELEPSYINQMLLQFLKDGTLKLDGNQIYFSKNQE